jgi:UDP-N-acetylglucosamine 2-epimerase (non-hydrolysing)
MKTIVHVVGARPNYMKVAPVMRALRGARDVRQVLINTGQHYDEMMAGSFQKELELPVPDRDLGVGSATHAVQTAKIMVAFEEICLELKPDLVSVVGDVNSTMAASLVASKLLIPIAHVEAGLRSFDRTMPEEINRIVTDRLADLLLTPSRDADENLVKEGVPRDRVHLVGNVMIDTLLRFLPVATRDRIRDRVPIVDGEYGVMTLHRPSNVDDRETFGRILSAVARIAARVPIVFPVHPRTQARLKAFGFDGDLSRVVMTDPLGYVEFLSLTANARVILTDSGGLQEESTALGIPCLTLRTNTERPVTVTEGTNQVVGTDPTAIWTAFERALTMDRRSARRPELWDGRTGERIADVMKTYLQV